MLKGSQVYLRALEPADVELLYKWENDPKTWCVSNTLVPYSKHILEQYIANAHLDIYTSKQVRFIICKDNDEPVGCIDLFDFEPLHSRVGIGILIAEHCDRGCGLASDALNVLIKYCFDTLQLNQVFCNVTDDNETSLGLFKKNGFEITGTKRQWIKNGKEFKDEYLLQLINE